MEYSLSGMMTVMVISSVVASIGSMLYAYCSGKDILKYGAIGFLAGASIAGTVYAIAWGGSIAAIYIATGGLTYSQQIYAAFERGTAYVVRLNQPMQVYRWYEKANPNTALGRWWTNEYYDEAGMAIRRLAINPEWGQTVDGMATGVIPQGTEILVGRAAAQGCLPGGGIQIFINNANVIQDLTL